MMRGSAKKIGKWSQMDFRVVPQATIVLPKLASVVDTEGLSSVTRRCML